jgi:hypothetical protein
MTPAAHTPLADSFFSIHDNAIQQEHYTAILSRNRARNYPI